MSQFPKIDAASFQQEVLNSSVPVLVEFSAVWCGPCKMLDPILEKLAAEWGARMRLVKVDVDESVDLTMRYQIMSVPTLLLFKEGQARERLSGYQPREKITARLNPHLS